MMKRFFLLAFISCQFLLAQQVTFFRTYGHGIYDSGEGVLQANDTGYVVGGITSQSGSNGTDVLIYKTDSMGVLEWFKNIGLNNSIEGAKSICKGIGGSGYLLAGYQNNYDTSGYNFYAVKTDLNGDTLWTRTYGGSDWDMAYAVDTLQDSTYVMAGETYSFGAGNLDMYVIRINQNGDTLWTRTFGGTEDDYAKYAYVDRHNNIMVIGTTNSFGAGGSDVYIVYLNKMGDTIWTKTYGTSVDEYGYSGDMYINNGGYLSFSYAYTQLDPASLQQESRLFRGDSVACNPLADIPLFFSQPPILDHVRMRMDGKGRFYYTGDMRSSDNGPTNIYLHRTLYGMVFSSTQLQIPIPESEYPHDVRKCFDNGLVVTGTNTFYGPGPTSSFILKTDTVLSSPIVPVVALEDMPSLEFSIYPNPVTNQTITVNAGQPIESIRLFDMWGRMVQVVTGSHFNTQTTLFNYVPAGMYIVEVVSNNGIGRKKIIISN